ncbi:3-hydroxyacyl-CoA dehydrogenase family protein [Paracoccus chinensis]|uniref:3-hydroxybutyryl-CoA dehydrogenase n=1 Tax=Paracoccus chinensis TaxID=525640 RepID=A0A1G9JY90_9RHOB|nr:3-hydroxyacyl-CoA dehydrogenase NAD-binding domain-containing protein [Paracoccus chinensis]SDL42481.1 3-hydroxybutyryl-CoA dehydrogenase [Paracoccus chinensis]
MTSTSVAVIVGGGTMGADVAIVFARGGWRVVVVEPAAERRQALGSYWTVELDKTGHGAAAGAMSAEAKMDDLAWDNVAIVVDCAPERLDVKRVVFETAARLARADAILASNSSGFPISQIVQGLPHPERCAGLHFFMPAHLVPLVEVVSSAETNQETAERLMTIMRDLGRVPVHVRRDLPGFLANRMQHALAREAFALIEAGIASAEDVDAAVRFGFGFRFLAAGPALQRDHAGLDVHCAAAATMYPSLSVATQPSSELRDRVEAGRLGMKTGAGFYDWTPETIAAERERYQSALAAALDIIADDLPQIRPLEDHR